MRCLSQKKGAYPSEINVNDSSITRESIMQYIDARILFPEEIRQAEQLLRQTNELAYIPIMSNA